MRNIIGKICITLGVILILGAGGLFLYNRAEAATAEQSAQELMPKLVQTIVDQQNESQMPVQTPVQTPEQPAEPEKPTVPVLKPVYTMEEVKIDGHNYIGFLVIPKLNLELPVMADWSYPKLRIAPCRYHGTVLGEDLVIMAHNYRSHFGGLSQLSVGAQVQFVDMDGKRWVLILGDGHLSHLAIDNEFEFQRLKSATSVDS